MSSQDSNRKSKKFSRDIVFTHDIIALTHCHEQTARRMLNNVRLALGKSKTALVTVYEVCKIFEIDEELLRNAMT